MKKNFIILVCFTLLLAFSCKNQAQTVPEEKPTQTETEETATGSVNSGDAATADKPVPEKTKPQTPKAKPKEAQKPQPPKETPKPVEPKIDPAKAPAEAEVKKAETLLAECTKVGVPKNFPNEFNSAKADVTAAKNAANAKNYAQAKTSAVKAQTKLQTLLNLNRSVAVKSEITDKQFEGAAAQEYSNAEIAYIKATENFGKNDSQALDYSKTAVKNYESVLNKGYVAWVKGAFEAATKAKAQCDGIKASKSAAAEYAAADKFYTAAKAAEQKKNYNDAYAGYVSAQDGFVRIYDKVSVLRAEALKAMQKASAQQQVSSELAAEADAVIPLTEGDPKTIQEAVDAINATEAPETPEEIETPVIENAPVDTGSEN
ncbi:MAG: hypothetical protein P1P63_06850 [Treponemataceae bacterium]